MRTMTCPTCAGTGSIDLAGMLSPREREVLLEAAHGYRTKEVAERLGLSLQTTKNHLSGVYRKLGVEGLVEAIWVLWLEEHLGEDQSP